MEQNEDAVGALNSNAKQMAAGSSPAALEGAQLPDALGDVGLIASQGQQLSIEGHDHSSRMPLQVHLLLEARCPLQAHVSLEEAPDCCYVFQGVQSAS